MAVHYYNEEEVIVSNHGKFFYDTARFDDIINIDLVMQRGLKLINIGVSNPNNIVLKYKRGNKEHNLILKEEKNNELVISFYSID